MWLFFFFLVQDRTGRRKWCLVRREQIGHPISHRSSILFSSPFLRSPCPLLILAPSLEPASASHPYSPILALPAPSPLTFCTAKTSKSRCHLVLSLSLFRSFLLFFSLFLLHSSVFPSPSLSPSLGLSHSPPLPARGVGFHCRGARWISDCCRAARSTLIGQSKPGRRGKGTERKKRKKKKNWKRIIFFHWVHMTIIAPLPFPPPLFPSLSRSSNTL